MVLPVLAGHSDVRLTTQTYAHVQAEALRRAAGVLDRVGLEGRDEGGRCPGFRPFGVFRIPLCPLKNDPT